MDTLAFVVAVAAIVAAFIGTFLGVMEALKRRDERELARLRQTWRRDDWTVMTMPLPLPRVAPARLPAPRRISKIAS